MRLDDAIERDPNIVSGALCFKGTRVPVQTLFDHLEADQIEEFYEDFPGVTHEMVEAVLRASSKLLEENIPLAKSA